MTLLPSYTTWLREQSTTPLEEGLYDPGVLKVVFMAGAAGSGKSYTVAYIADIDSDEMRGIRPELAKKTMWVGATGLRTINSDIAFTRSLRKAGIDPASLDNIEKTNPELWQQIQGTPETIRGRAFRLTDAQRLAILQGRLGMLYDSTGQNYSATKFDKDDFTRLGYDTMMVFVNTPLEVALRQNASRPRRLPDSIIQTVWQKTHNNIQEYLRLFGSDRFIEFFNIRNDEMTPEQRHAFESTLKPHQSANMARVRTKVQNFVKAPVENPLGQAWMQAEREKRRR